MKNVEAGHILDNFILENKLNALRLGDYCLTDNPLKVIKNIDYDKKNNYWFLDNNSAFNFKTDKQYNWIFEFDRHGINPVLYQYEKNRTWYKAVLSLYDIAVGSFSDISALDGLGCCAINFGTAYYLEHTKKCFCDITDLNTYINKFLIFYNKNKNIYYNFECEKGYKNSAKQELNNGI